MKSFSTFYFYAIIYRMQIHTIAYDSFHFCFEINVKNLYIQFIFTTVCYSLSFCQIAEFKLPTFGLAVRLRDLEEFGKSQIWKKK